MRTFRVGTEWHNCRVDRFLKHHFPSAPHALLCKLLKKRAIRVSSSCPGQSSTPSARRLKLGDTVYVRSEALETEESYGGDRATGNPLKGWCVFEDEWVTVLNKPAGVVCQGGRNASEDICSRVSHAGLHLIHRLDYSCSGALLLAKHRLAAATVNKLWQGRSDLFQKTYISVVCGNLEHKVGQNGM